jgi:hypothetical protein
MPAMTWTEQEKKEFWRSARAALWATLIVVAILLALKVITPPVWLGVLLVLIYAVALYIPIYKAIRAKWGK